MLTSTADSTDDDLLSSVLGVIDLKGGKAVHAVRGNRDSYRPVCCAATSDGDPIALAQMYLDCGVGGVYVADLDAITAGSPHDDLLNRLADLGAPIWIDAGVVELQLPAIERIVRVVGTESIAALDELVPLRERWGAQRHAIVLSIDLRAGVVLAGSSALASQTAVEIASQAIGYGFDRLIALDLAAVGAASGTLTSSICRAIAVEHPHVELTSGGGIRTLADIRILKEGGCRYVLVGTALHGGRKKLVFDGGTC
ncbi:1-(5-phosphoribosyl)-5-[(5-phosphoribosylamino)methylideneamino] imidazole-4-carboxamide isomerase [Rosistilla carotiformis]|uniref:1-(5-phosphoribosyl)-5-[(5-phosphoribosylamino)methylideneamino] imidazole-4-carboxamide isomerase n=1 Tax=Rosistilla carotiformis TaxID=2528017 RepID=A0A518JNK6_9BACT|nr:HisA/HisF-related TIM barrel protein [Rosistilla carotiformis]QDV67126.1 1-(5-phosphoribosyl)-5-[(5-phosphoribosylamino)methylideneamino] imidazole-4-carboxamide isomerase [Rosistilla carotiformis]